MYISRISFKIDLQHPSYIYFESSNHNVVVTLLRLLIFYADLLNANRLRDLIKSDLVELHLNFTNTGNNDSTVSATLAICIFYTLLLEFAYLSKPSTEEPSIVWQRIMDSKVIIISILLYRRLIYSGFRIFGNSSADKFVISKDPEL